MAFRVLPFLLYSTIAFAQLDSNSVTVTASRTLNLQPDEVSFAVAVSAGPDVELPDVLATLQGVGITAANFTGTFSSFVYVTDPPAPAPFPLVAPLRWNFSLNVPISKIKDTMAALNAAQKSLVQTKSRLILSFSVQNAHVSQQLQAQACAQADLIADARAKAQKLADAAGMNLGVLLGMSSTESCSLAAKFALSRY